MPEYQCRVASGTGDVFEKSYIAEDESRLRRDLENQDLMLLDVRRRNPLLADLAKIFRLRTSVPLREFLLFNQEFSALVRAGLPIVQSLGILLERRKNQAFKQTLMDIRERVRSGEALSEAFGAHREMFPSLYSASLASGERSGELGTVLVRFIAYTQKILAIRSRVVSAMVYPVILITLSAGLISLMVFFIIPRFTEFLDDFGTDLPLITRAVMGLADFCGAYWHFIIGGSLAGVIGMGIWKRTPRGREVIDGLKLRLPLVGKALHDYAQNRFTRTLSTLQAGGIHLVTSLELSARAVGNAVFERALLGVAEKVREGRPLWESIEETHLLDDITVQMIRVGESTGALEEMLDNASEFTDQEIDNRLTRVMALIEPLMLVFMAIIVAIMLMAIYLPLVNLYGGGGQGF